RNFERISIYSTTSPSTDMRNGRSISRPAGSGHSSGSRAAGSWRCQYCSSRRPSGWSAAARPKPARTGFADSVTARRPRWPKRRHNGTVRPDRIRRGRVAAAKLLVFCGVTLAVIALAPVIVLAGEPLRRYYLRRLNRPPLRMRSGVVQSRYGPQRGVLRRMTWRGHPVAGYALSALGYGRLRRRSIAGWRGRWLGRVIIANPVLIVLTAPGRWTIDRVGGLRSGGSGRGFGRFGRRGGDWPPPAGVREPRRPKPSAPGGA